jgi:hypothetical protein
LTLPAAAPQLSRLAFLSVILKRVEEKV